MPRSKKKKLLKDFISNICYYLCTEECIMLHKLRNEKKTIEKYLHFFLFYISSLKAFKINLVKIQIFILNVLKNAVKFMNNRYLLDQTKETPYGWIHIFHFMFHI